MSLIQNISAASPLTISHHLGYALGTTQIPSNCVKDETKRMFLILATAKIIAGIGVIFSLSKVQRNVLNPFPYIVFVISHDILAVSHKLDTILKTKMHPVTGAAEGALGWVTKLFSSSGDSGSAQLFNVMSLLKAKTTWKAICEDTILLRHWFASA